MRWWRRAVIYVCFGVNAFNLGAAVLDLYRRRGINITDTFILVASSICLVGFTLANYLTDKWAEVWDAQRLRYEADTRTAEKLRELMERNNDPHTPITFKRELH